MRIWPGRGRPRWPEERVGRWMADRLGREIADAAEMEHFLQEFGTRDEWEQDWLAFLYEHG